jgi:hypothetical protein
VAWKGQRTPHCIRSSSAALGRRSRF